jgi:Ala-tRNA(Pro) deacylase
MLEANQIEFKLFEHIPVQTSEEAAKLRGVTMASGAKAMLLWRKSKNANDVDPNSFILTVMSAEKKLSWSIIR